MSAAAVYPTAPCTLSRPTPPRRRESCGGRGRPKLVDPHVRRSYALERWLDTLLEEDRQERGISRTEQVRDALFLYLCHRRQGLPLSGVTGIRPPELFLEVLPPDPGEDTTPSPGPEESTSSITKEIAPSPEPERAQRLQPEDIATAFHEEAVASPGAEVTRHPTDEASPALEADGAGEGKAPSEPPAAPASAPPEESEEDPDAWLTEMMLRHAPPGQEGTEMFSARYPHLRFVSCDIPDCDKRAAMTYKGKNLCQEHGRGLQEMERVIRPEQPRPTPPCPAPLPSCSVCQERRYQFIARDGQARAEACPVCLGQCQACGGVGWHSYEWEDRSYSEPCRCTLLARRRALFNTARVPALYVPFLTGPLTPPRGYTFSQSQLEAVSRVDALVEGFQVGARGIVFWGEVGTSKTTQLARALAGLTLRRSVRAVFVEWGGLLEETKNTWQTKEENPILPLYKVPVLAIDDVGKRPLSSEWQEAQLDHLISARYQGKLTTLISTNCRPTGKGSLQERLGHRLYDRLLEQCDFIEVVGRNLRHRQPRSGKSR